MRETQRESVLRCWFGNMILQSYHSSLNAESFNKVPHDDTLHLETCYL